MRKFQLSARTTPAALLVLCLASFGLLIPWLGFYWDDWPVILMTRLQGADGFLEFYKYDRPFSAWTYILTTPILGVQPFGWHVLTLLLRWSTALGLWWSLRGLWPARSRQATWIALLFAVYPAFTQQSIAVAYSQHWTCYALYFLSLGSMIQSIRSPRWFWPLTLASLAASALSMFTMEYFIGLELLRPLILWLLVSEKESAFRKRIASTLRLWSPYLLVFAAFAFWRLFILEIPGGDPNRPDLLYTLISSPLSGVIRLFQAALQDTIHILVAVWFNTLQPQTIDLNDRFMLLSIGTGLLSAAGVALYLASLKNDAGDEPPLGERSWLGQAALLGGLALVLGPLPAWITGRQVLIGLYGDRFALAGTFGASLLIVAFIEWLSSRTIPKLLFFSALIGLAVGLHLRTANEYRWIWTEQTRFYWQLAWRAPHLEPRTALLSDGELFKYVGEYSTAAVLNLLYPHPTQEDMPYWFFDLDRNFRGADGEFQQGMEIKRKFRSFSYQGNSLDSILISYEPEQGSCLQVYSPQYDDIRELSEYEKDYLPVSNLSRIYNSPSAPGYPPEEIFGPEPEHTWCYYYQKAELARQTQDWDTIVELGEEAERLGHGANDMHEWLPFIEGYAHSGQAARARELTEHVSNIIPRLAPELCEIWASVEGESSTSPEFKIEIQKVRQRLDCAGETTKVSPGG